MADNGAGDRCACSTAALGSGGGADGSAVRDADGGDAADEATGEAETGGADGGEGASGGGAVAVVDGGGAVAEGGGGGCEGATAAAAAAAYRIAGRGAAVDAGRGPVAVGVGGRPALSADDIGC
jgi:hypothetical protein